MAKSITTRLRKARSFRSLLSLLVLLVFTTQSFLVQTHLHNLTAQLSSSRTAVSAPDKAPVSTENCLLCQEFTHSGGFVLPAAVAALPPTAALSLLPLALVPLVHGRTASHDWKGRAPPHA